MDSTSPSVAEGTMIERLERIIKKYNAKSWVILLIPFLLGLAFGNIVALPVAVACFKGTDGLKVPTAFSGLAVLLGICLGGNFQLALLALAVMVVAVILEVPFENKKGETSSRHGIQAAISVAVVTLVASSIHGTGINDLVIAMEMALLSFIFVHILRKAGEAAGLGNNIYMTQEGQIYVGVVLVALVQVLPAISLMDFDLRIACMIAITQYFASKVGGTTGITAGVFIGAVSGIITGFMNSGNVADATFVFVLAGFFSGVFYRYGRLAGTLGFVLTSSIILLIDDAKLITPISMQTLIISTLAIIIVPAISSVAKFDLLKKFDFPQTKADAGKQPFTLSERLGGIGNSIREFVKAFGETGATQLESSKDDTCSMFNRIAGKVCEGCNSSEYCWENKFFETCKAMVHMTGVLESNRHLKRDDIPRFLRDKCLRQDQLISAVSTTYEVLQTEEIWRERMRESKELMTRQLMSISSLINSMARDIGKSRIALWAIEREIEEALDKDFKEVEAYVWRDKKGRFEIEIIPSNCQQIEWDCEHAAKIISRITRKRIAFDCLKYRDEDFLTAKFVEADVLDVYTGVAQRSKHSLDVCGDSFTNEKVRNGVHLVGLSDGMGTGAQAANFSSAAVNLIEGLISGGIDIETAASFVNATMLLQEEGEAFVTLDMAMIDLFDGETQFLKVGAAPTIIKNEGNIELVTSTMMPAGIVGDFEMTPEIKKLKDGDMLVFMSDGVFEALISRHDEDNIINMIKLIDSETPQRFADEILEMACDGMEDECPDDMSVMAIKIWKKGTMKAA